MVRSWSSVRFDSDDACDDLGGLCPRRPVLAELKIEDTYCTEMTSKCRIALQCHCCILCTSRKCARFYIVGFSVGASHRA